MIYRTHIKYLQSLVRLSVVIVNSLLFNLLSENIKQCLFEEYMLNYYKTKQNTKDKPIILSLFVEFRLLEQILRSDKK